jgi:hypothetical protein
MSIVARLELPDAVAAPSIMPSGGASFGPGFDLVRCIRAFDGWVAPDGLAPRAVLDRLVGQGRLEAWPGRPLYRAPRVSALVPAGDAA